MNYTATMTTVDGKAWLSVNPLSGRLAAGASIPLSVLLDVVTPALTPRTYTGAITIAATTVGTGSPATGSPISIPVNMTVTPPLGQVLTIVDSEVDLGPDTSIAIGLDGFPVVSYASTGAIKVAHCGNAACSAGNTLTTVDSGNFGGDTSIAIGVDGFPVVSYASLRGVRVAHCGNATCSSSDTFAAVGIVGFSGSYVSIAIGVDGFPVVGYTDTGGTLWVAHCGNVACSAGNTHTIVDRQGGNSDISIAIGGDGFPVVSYRGIDFGGIVTVNDTISLIVAHCGNAICSAGNTSVVIVDSEFAGYDASMAIGRDGFPVISYYLFDSETLLAVAHCRNANCTGFNDITIVDNVASLGTHTSIAIGVDGFPVVSYFGGTNADLKVAHCRNAACSGISTLTTVDSTGKVGTFSSIAIGVDGFPVVSYRDHTNAPNSTLKVAHCGNTLCTP
jgi:hypothetical protein